MKKLTNKVISTIMACVIAVSAPAALVRADDSAPGKYVSEVFIAYGKTQDEANQWLIDNGWEPIKGDNDFTAGKASAFDSNIVTAMGIKRTDKVDEAVTDMAVMNMKGGYSIPAYENLVEEKKAEINEFINNFIPVLNEYRDNYNGAGSALGKSRAEMAHSILNRFTDGDDLDLYMTGTETLRPIGDLLLEKTKQEGNESGADLEQIILEGSGPAVTAIEQFIAFSADSSETTWLERLSSISGDDLADNIAEYVPESAGQDLAPSAITNLLNGLFKDNAILMAGQWKNVNEMLLWYENYNNDNDLWDHEGESLEDYTARVDKYFADLKEIDEDKYEEEKNKYANYGLLYSGLYGIEYAGSWGDTLGDFFNPADGSDYSTEVDLFLPLVAVLSEGQKRALEIVSLSSLLFMGFANEAGIDQAKPQIDEVYNDPDTTFSVFMGINRAIFRGGVALTSQALMEQNMGRGEAYNGIWSHTGLAAIISYSAAALGVITMIAGGVMMANGKITTTTVTVQYLSSNEELMASAQKSMETAKNLRKFFMDNYTRISEPGKGLEIADRNLYNAQQKFLEARGPETRIENTTTSTSTMGYAGRWMLGIGGALLIGAAVLEAVNLYKYYQREFTPIPRMIVDEADIVSYTTDSNGEEIKNIEFDQYVYYDSVKCNRQEVGEISDWQDGVEDYEKEGCGDIADLNGDFGQEWLALYRVKSLKKGNPILADSLKLQYGSDKQPEGTTQALHFFTYTYALDLGDMAYSYNNKKDGVYLFWGVDENYEASVAASTFSGGTIALAAAGGLVVGILAATLVLLPKRRKKEEA